MCAKRCCAARMPLCCVASHSPPHARQIASHRAIQQILKVMCAPMLMFPRVEPLYFSSENLNSRCAVRDLIMLSLLYRKSVALGLSPLRKSIVFCIAAILILNAAVFFTAMVQARNQQTTLYGSRP